VKYLVRISDRAERDLEQVLAWFQEQRAMTAASRWYGNLMSNVSTLEQHPQRCSLAAEAEEMGIEVRELLFGRKPGFIGFCFSMSRREWRFCEFVTLLAIHWQRKNSFADLVFA